MKKSETYMQLENGVWWHDANHPDLCKMYSPGLPVHKVEVIEGAIEGEQYHAWWENKDNCFIMIWPRKSLVEMCFPYGTKPEEELGRGFLLPVTIKDLEKVLD